MRAREIADARVRLIALVEIEVIGRPCLRVRVRGRIEARDSAVADFGPRIETVVVPEPGVGDVEDETGAVQCRELHLLHVRPLRIQRPREVVGEIRVVVAYTVAVVHPFVMQVVEVQSCALFVICHEIFTVVVDIR